VNETIIGLNRRIYPCPSIIVFSRIKIEIAGAKESLPGKTNHTPFNRPKKIEKAKIFNTGELNII
tara:strand:- start:412 stop:606 length:195 start_codon:yes stop_codon:yes gene_type:complete